MVRTLIYLQSGTGSKKYKVIIIKPNGQKKTVQFGAKGYSDFTIHKDKQRKKNYESRHKSRENWGISGITTAGFWAKWLLWNKPSLQNSIQSTSRKFGITIKRGSPKSKRNSPKRNSKSPKRKSPKRKSRSHKRKSPKRKSPKRKSPKRKSRSHKRKSPKRKSKSPKRRS
jgi:hypothetical protein